jgi:coenzyme F420-0:L-glutamate ligase / coenzyme F420-1:gamma-L-glutamate ligase
LTVPLTLTPLVGMPEVRAGADLAGLLVAAVERSDEQLLDGDVLVVSSKVVSKALGLWAEAGADRDAVIARQSRRVVAERRSGERLTRIVQSASGPVMAAAGVDASNTGDADRLLLLPDDPDAEARRLRSALVAGSGCRRLGLVLSDTAGRPWRAGQVDFALGAAGLAVLDDLRGGVDADGRPLAVTARALADELAAAADLVKGKADGVPAALVRGAGGWVVEHDSDGAAALVRTGPEDWFGYGHAEAVRAALGVEPGSPAAADCGVAAVHPEPVTDRIARAVRVALHGLPDVGIDVGSSDVRVSADDPFTLGRAVARVEVALWGEGLRGHRPTSPPGLTQSLEITEA